MFYSPYNRISWLKFEFGKLFNMLLQISWRPHEMELFSTFCWQHCTWTPNQILFAEINNDFSCKLLNVVDSLKWDQQNLHPSTLKTLNSWWIQKSESTMNLKIEENVRLLIKHLWCKQRIQIECLESRIRVFILDLTFNAHLDPNTWMSCEKNSAHCIQMQLKCALSFGDIMKRIYLRGAISDEC